MRNHSTQKDAHIASKIWAIAVLVIFSSLTSLPAAAEFGLEDEPVMEVPADETLVKAVVANPVPDSGRKQTHLVNLAEAIGTFREYQAAFLNEDSEYLLAVLSEPERSAAVEVLRKESLSYYVNEKEKIVTWEIHCGACWVDEAEGPQCTLIDRRYIHSEYNNKYYSEIYLLVKDNDFVTISERHVMYERRGRILKKMQKKNGRVCSLDEYDLQLGTPNKTNAAKSLLKGLTSVVRRLGT